MKNETRVLIDLTKTKNLYTGLGQFCFHLGHQMSAMLDESFVPTLLLPPERESLFRGEAPVKLARFGDTLPSVWGKLIRRQDANYNVWHVTDQDSKYWPSTTSIPVVYTIHDLNFLREKTNQEKIDRRLKLIQKRIHQAEVVTTISHYVASEVAGHFDLGGKSIEMIYNGGPSVADSAGVEDSYAGDQVSKAGIEKRELVLPALNLSLRSALKDKPFLFSIGEVVKKKNFHVLVDMMENLPGYHLIISGKKETQYGKYIEEKIITLGLSSRVFLSGNICDEDREWLYQRCAAFVFPSITEGFGLPVIEAMHYGKPVFTSNSTSLPEVTSGLGYYWNHYEPEYMATIFRDGLAKFDGEKAQRNKVHAASFSWQTTAERYVELYNQIVSNG